MGFFRKKKKNTEADEQHPKQKAARPPRPTKSPTKDSKQKRREAKKAAKAKAKASRRRGGGGKNASIDNTPSASAVASPSTIESIEIISVEGHTSSLEAVATNLTSRLDACQEVETSRQVEVQVQGNDDDEYSRISRVSRASMAQSIYTNDDDESDSDDSSFSSDSDDSDSSGGSSTLTDETSKAHRDDDGGESDSLSSSSSASAGNTTLDLSKDTRGRRGFRRRFRRGTDLSTVDGPDDSSSSSSSSSASSASSQESTFTNDKDTSHDSIIDAHNLEEVFSELQLREKEEMEEMKKQSSIEKNEAKMNKVSMQAYHQHNLNSLDRYAFAGDGDETFDLDRDEIGLDDCNHTLVHTDTSINTDLDGDSHMILYKFDESLAESDFENSKHSNCNSFQNMANCNTFEVLGNGKGRRRRGRKGRGKGKGRKNDLEYYLNYVTCGQTGGGCLNTITEQDYVACGQAGGCLNTVTEQEEDDESTIGSLRGHITVGDNEQEKGHGGKNAKEENMNIGSAPHLDRVVTERTAHTTNRSGRDRYSGHHQNNRIENIVNQTTPNKRGSSDQGGNNNHPLSDGYEFFDRVCSTPPYTCHDMQEHLHDKGLKCHGSISTPSTTSASTSSPDVMDEIYTPMKV